MMDIIIVIVIVIIAGVAVAAAAVAAIIVIITTGILAVGTVLLLHFCYQIVFARTKEKRRKLVTN